MKTAISLPDTLFDTAERYAKKHGLSLSDLYEAAVSEFIERRKKKERKNITKKINEICDSMDTSPNPQTKSASRHILLDSEW